MRRNKLPRRAYDIEGAVVSNLARTTDKARRVEAACSRILARMDRQWAYTQADLVRLADCGRNAGVEAVQALVARGEIRVDATGRYARVT